MKLPILFNEKLPAITSLPMEMVAWDYYLLILNPREGYKLACPIEDPKLPLILYGSARGKRPSLMPACLNIKSDLGDDDKQFLQELAAKGTLQKERKYYNLKVTKYQELTLTKKVLKKLGDLLDKEERKRFILRLKKDKKGPIWTTKKVFARFFKVSLINEKETLSQNFLYLPLFHNHLFEKVLLPQLFTKEATSFIRNSFLEYLYYSNLAVLPATPTIRPYYRVINTYFYENFVDEPKDPLGILAKSIFMKSFLIQYNETHKNKNK